MNGHQACPVRVTLEGTLYRASETRGVLQYDGPEGRHTAVLVLDSPALVVEDMTPLHTWQAGDVLVNTEHHWTLTRRQDGSWLLSHDATARWTDADVDEALETAPYDQQLKVLRYQAGGI